MSDKSISESEESVEVVQIERPQERCRSDVAQASPRLLRPSRAPKRKDAECAAKLN